MIISKVHFQSEEVILTKFFHLFKLLSSLCFTIRRQILSK